MDTIFVQIAAYRDSELIPTIDDCLMNANQPQRIRFGICNQTDDGSELDRYSMDSRFRIISVPFESSKGVCWARNRIQKSLYQDETYTLQIDSHHRFVKGWDERLARMLVSLQAMGHPKPLITAYAPGFNPLHDPQERKQEVWVLAFDRFTPEGAALFMPHAVTDSVQLQEPIAARFYSAHFAFTLGAICREVPHDPDYYFHGEEISVGVRAFTHGYDLFHPNEIILWHEYKRKTRPLHWDDHPGAAVSIKAAFKRNRILFGMEPRADTDFGEYGFGVHRTLAEYEKFAGIRFHDRSVQRHTLQNRAVPNPANSEWVAEFKYPIKIPKLYFSENDYEFWGVAFHNTSGKTVFRQDADKSEVQRILAESDEFVTILRAFPTDRPPVRWVVRPFTALRGWNPILYGDIPSE